MGTESGRASRGLQDGLQPFLGSFLLSMGLEHERDTGCGSHTDTDKGRGRHTSDASHTRTILLDSGNASGQALVMLGIQRRKFGNRPCYRHPSSFLHRRNELPRFRHSGKCPGTGPALAVFEIHQLLRIGHARNHLRWPAIELGQRAIQRPDIRINLLRYLFRRRLVCAAFRLLFFFFFAPALRVLRRGPLFRTSHASCASANVFGSMSNSAIRSTVSSG